MEPVKQPIGTTTPIRIPFKLHISLLITYLLSPPTLQVTSNSSVAEEPELHHGDGYGKHQDLDSSQ